MCAVMRRTWRLRPSIKVMANHVVGIAARKRTAGLRGQSVGSGMMSTFAVKSGHLLRSLRGAMPQGRSLVANLQLAPSKFLALWTAAESIWPAKFHHWLKSVVLRYRDPNVLRRKHP